MRSCILLVLDWLLAVPPTSPVEKHAWKRNTGMLDLKGAVNKSPDHPCLILSPIPQINSLPELSADEAYPTKENGGSGCSTISIIMTVLISTMANINYCIGIVHGL